MVLNPDAAATWAIPLPIVPAPQMQMVVIKEITAKLWYNNF
jgi:hypothetical protein